MASLDLTTVPSVKQWLGLQNASDDALLAALVSSASAWVQQYINRTIPSASYAETYNGNGKSVLALRNTPIQSVASVTVDDVAIPARTSTTSAGYSYDDALLYLDGVGFATARAVPGWGGYLFAPGRQNVVVNYTAGYTTIPLDLAQATVEIAALAYRERDRIGISSKAQEGQTIAYLVRQLPVRVQTTLDQWKRVPLL